MAKICFTPIWYPIEKYVTSRLRARSAVELFAGDPKWQVRIGYHADADVAVIVQLCNDRNLQKILKNRDQLVVYDICDRYFETDNTFDTDEGPLRAHSRCLEVIARADMLIAPTRHLSDELSSRFLQKPCFHIPELVDYGASPHAVSRAGSRRLLWFGHATRGNFESARWIIDHLRSHFGYQPILMTTPSTFAQWYPSYAEFCVAWSPTAIRQEFARAELCIVTHAADEPGKSANRFVTAIMHGVPTLVSRTPSCVEILDAAGYGKLAVSTPGELRHAIEWLSSSDRRTVYVTDLQKAMWRRHAPDVVRCAYIDLFDNILLKRSK